MKGQKKKLQLFNSDGREKQEFTPANDPVAMYCCGPTVYNYAHIGNLRTYVFEDVLKRVLLFLGYKVRHVVNITDVGHLTSDEDSGEDKMEKGAKREGKSVWDIAARFTKAFMDDIAALNIIPADTWPKATNHIAQMIDMVGTLEKKGYTYTTADGIYFDTSKYPDYTKFAGLDPDNMRAGERVDMGDKRNLTDFALWKFSPIDEKRQMEWDSPWGVGFPGWHIECSAMSMAYLPLPVDIHCGGADHIRVHHSNEIAQSEAATGNRFVRYWLHGEFLVMDKGKMAKSGGNFLTLTTLKEKGVSPLAYRMFCFSAHYRSPLSFSWEGIEAATQSLARLRKTVHTLVEKTTSGTIVAEEAVEGALQQFYAAICDDMNMPRAIAALWEIIRDDSFLPAVRVECVKRADAVFALDLLSYEEVGFDKRTGPDGGTVLFACDVPVSEELINSVLQKLAERKNARAAKEWAVADAIRDQFKEYGVDVKDQKDGSTVVEVPKELVSDLQHKKQFIEG